MSMSTGDLIDEMPTECLSFWKDSYADRFDKQNLRTILSESYLKNYTYLQFVMFPELFSQYLKMVSDSELIGLFGTYVSILVEFSPEYSGVYEKQEKRMLAKQFIQDEQRTGSQSLEKLSVLQLGKLMTDKVSRREELFYQHFNKLPRCCQILKTSAHQLDFCAFNQLLRIAQHFGGLREDQNVKYSFWPKTHSFCDYTCIKYGLQSLVGQIFCRIIQKGLSHKIYDWSIPDLLLKRLCEKYKRICISRFHAADHQDKIRTFSDLIWSKMLPYLFQLRNLELHIQTMRTKQHYLMEMAEKQPIDWYWKFFDFLCQAWQGLTGIFSQINSQLDYSSKQDSKYFVEMLSKLKTITLSNTEQQGQLINKKTPNSAEKNTTSEISSNVLENLSNILSYDIKEHHKLIFSSMDGQEENNGENFDISMLHSDFLTFLQRIQKELKNQENIRVKNQILFQQELTFWVRYIGNKIYEILKEPFAQKSTLRKLYTEADMMCQFLLQIIDKLTLGVDVQNSSSSDNTKLSRNLNSIYVLMVCCKLIHESILCEQSKLKGKQLFGTFDAINLFDEIMEKENYQSGSKVQMTQQTSIGIGSWPSLESVVYFFGSLLLSSDIEQPQSQSQSQNVLEKLQKFFSRIIAKYSQRVNMNSLVGKQDMKLIETMTEIRQIVLEYNNYLTGNYESQNNNIKKDPRVSENSENIKKGTYCREYFRVIERRILKLISEERKLFQFDNKSCGAIKIKVLELLNSEVILSKFIACLAQTTLSKLIEQPANMDMDIVEPKKGQQSPEVHFSDSDEKNFHKSQSELQFSNIIDLKNIGEFFEGVSEKWICLSAVPGQKLTVKHQPFVELIKTFNLQEVQSCLSKIVKKWSYLVKVSGQKKKLNVIQSVMESSKSESIKHTQKVCMSLPAIYGQLCEFICEATQICLQFKRYQNLEKQLSTLIFDAQQQTGVDEKQRQKILVDRLEEISLRVKITIREIISVNILHLNQITAETFKLSSVVVEFGGKNQGAKEQNMLKSYQQFLSQILNMTLLLLSKLFWIQFEVENAIEMLRPSISDSQNGHYEAPSCLWLLRCLIVSSLNSSVEVNYEQLQKQMQSMIESSEQQYDGSEVSETVSFQSKLSFDKAMEQLVYVYSNEILEFLYEYFPFRIESYTEEMKFYNLCQKINETWSNHQWISVQKQNKIRFIKIISYLDLIKESL